MTQENHHFVDAIPSEDVYTRSFRGKTGALPDRDSMLEHAVEVRKRALSAASDLDRSLGFIAVQE